MSLTFMEVIMFQRGVYSVGGCSYFFVHSTSGKEGTIQQDHKLQPLKQVIITILNLLAAECI